VAPERMYDQPTILTTGFEPWSQGAPLHLFLNDALSHTPTRPLLLMLKENVLNNFKFQWIISGLKSCVSMMIDNRKLTFLTHVVKKTYDELKKMSTK
jgi:hypothetical protein